MYKIMLIFNLF